METIELEQQEHFAQIIEEWETHNNLINDNEKNTNRVGKKPTQRKRANHKK